MRPLRVVLVEDHTLVRAGLRAILAPMSEFDVVGEAGDGHAALKLIEALRPDIALMDISMPGLNGIEATRRAARLPEPPKVLIVSIHTDAGYVRQAMAAGASGYVLKSADPEELKRALLAVARGEVWLSPPVARTVIDDIGSYDAGPASSLTGRQREVLQLIAEGRSTRQIAKQLQISVKTVETHRAQLMERLDIRTVAGLVRFAIRAGIASEEEPPP